MTKNEIHDAVVQILDSTLAFSPNPVTSATTLASLGADSLDAIDIALDLEDKFGVDLDDEEERLAAPTTTIGDIVDAIHAKRNAESE